MFYTEIWVSYRSLQFPVTAFELFKILSMAMSPGSTASNVFQVSVTAQTAYALHCQKYHLCSTTLFVSGSLSSFRRHEIECSWRFSVFGVLSGLSKQ